jgi:hypothetical protein
VGGGSVILKIEVIKLEQEFEILECYNTSLGLIARIRFILKNKPDIGKKIIYKEQEYEISGISSHSSPHASNVELKKRMEQGIYDCVLKPLNA